MTTTAHAAQQTARPYAERIERARVYIQAILDQHEGLTTPSVDKLAEELAYRLDVDDPWQRSLLRVVMHAACRIYIKGYDHGYKGAVTSGDYVEVHEVRELARKQATKARAK